MEASKIQYGHALESRIKIGRNNQKRTDSLQRVMDQQDTIIKARTNIFLR